MKKIRKPTALILIWAIVTLPTVSFSESVEDRFSQISPGHVPGSGEFTHGQGYGKLLIRVIMLGAAPQQGVHYVPEGTDLLFALIYAGGKSDTAKLSDITIRRRGVEKLIDVDLEELIEEGKSIPKLVDGDVVTIPYNWRYNMILITTLMGFTSAVTGFILAYIALLK